MFELTPRSEIGRVLAIHSKRRELPCAKCGVVVFDQRPGMSRTEGVSSPGHRMTDRQHLSNRTVTLLELIVAATAPRVSGVVAR